jgi:prevent-host-death family protein
LGADAADRGDGFWFPACQFYRTGYYGQIGYFTEFLMITITSVEAQSRFGELIDRSQREPIQVTRRGRAVAYVVSEHDMLELVAVRKRREEAANWYAFYKEKVASQPEAPALTDDDVARLVHELR